MWRIGSAKDWGGVGNGGMIAVLFVYKVVKRVSLKEIKE